MKLPLRIFVLTLLGWGTISGFVAAEEAADAASPVRVYRNELRRLENAPPLLADHPQYVQPVVEVHRFEAPPLIVDRHATLDVRAWRFSYNARGIIEMPNALDGSKTAIIMVHPWGIDDGQGWKMPVPAGVAMDCTFEKNEQVREHAAEIIDPFIRQFRNDVKLVLFSLRGPADSIRTQLYRSISGTPTAPQRREAREKLTRVLTNFDYRGEPIPSEFPLSTKMPVVDYFRQFPGLDAGPRYNNAGFWDLPIPVMASITLADDDVVFYDDEGYPALRAFLQQNEIQNVLLCGYATDMCLCATSAGYKNLRNDFNVLIVGDATQATCPANNTAAYATNQSLSFASLEQLITQVSWIKKRP